MGTARRIVGRVCLAVWLVGYMDVRFEYDRCIADAIRGFVLRALPGYDDGDVSYSIRGDASGDEEAYDVYASFEVDDGVADLHLRMVACPHAPGDYPDAHARVALIEATRDVQDVDGFHVRTEVWDDAAGRWEPFPEGPDLVVIDGGKSPR